MPDVRGNAPPNEEHSKPLPHSDIYCAHQYEFPCYQLPPNLPNYPIDHQHPLLSPQDAQNTTTNYQIGDQTLLPSQHSAVRTNYHYSNPVSRSYPTQPPPCKYFFHKLAGYRSIPNNHMPYVNQYPPFSYLRHNSDHAPSEADHSNYRPSYYNSRYFWKPPLNNYDQPLPSRFSYHTSSMHPSEDCSYAEPYSYQNYDYRGPFYGYPGYSPYRNFDSRPGPMFTPPEYQQNYFPNSANYNHAPQNTVPQVKHAQHLVAPKKERQIKPNDIVPHLSQKLRQNQNDQLIKESSPAKIASMEAINDQDLNKTKPINYHEINYAAPQVAHACISGLASSETCEIISDAPLKSTHAHQNSLANVCLDENRILRLPVGH
ncbi:hypothetical protein MXB_2177, partial [Myxobolus squamalis]